MSEAVQLALIASIAPTLAGLATLIATIATLRGGFRKLSNEVNGHTEKVIQAMHQVGKVQGQVEGLQQQMNPPQTTVIQDRRLTPRDEPPLRKPDVR